MSAIKELIRAEVDGSISFGDYTLDTKTKSPDFEHNGDLYKVKTFNEITRLERNGLFVYESVPGTSVLNLRESTVKMEFVAEGNGNTQVTVELEADTEYTVFIDGVNTGKVKTNLGGKLTISLEIPNLGLKYAKTFWYVSAEA